ncbi:MAG: GNAT family N-acetyltransferase [Hyphomonadaceae bacterium]
MVPVIETERLRLRGHELSDFDASAAMWGDPDVARFIGGKPSTREESWGRFLRYIGHWRALGHGFWLIEEKATGAFVGEGGMGAFKREIEPPLEAPEAGWALATAMHGKGYAHEAMRAALGWAEKHFDRTDFVCIIAPENRPSLTLADKLGFREYGRGLYKGETSVMLRRA